VTAHSIIRDSARRNFCDSSQYYYQLGMSTRSKSKNAHATRRRSPPRELSTSEIESLSTPSLRLHLGRLNLVTTGKRAQLVARLKAHYHRGSDSGTDGAESDAPSGEAANGRSASSEAARDKSASNEAASDKSSSSEDGSDHSTPQPSGEDPSSDELDDRVGDDFPYMEPPSKRRRTRHASELLSRSRSRMRSQGHRHRRQKGDSRRKEGRRSYRAHSSNSSSGDSRHHRSSSSASSSSDDSTIHHSRRRYRRHHHSSSSSSSSSSPSSDSSHGRHHLYRHHRHRSHKPDRAMVSCAQPIPVADLEI